MEGVFSCIVKLYQFLQIETQNLCIDFLINDILINDILKEVF